MGVDIQWRDAVEACKAAGHAFTKEEIKAGWPASMRLLPLAVMQRPFKRGDTEGKGKFKALASALTDAIADGSLAAEKTVVTAKKEVPDEHLFDPISLTEDAPYREPQDPVYQDVTETVYRVTQQAFAAWLRKQHEKPSVHVEAWFEVRGVKWMLLNADGTRQHEQDVPSDPSIIPPASWNMHSPFGFLRSQGHDYGNLVRLEDVLNGFAETLPRKHALHRLLVAMPKAVPSMFVLNVDDYADPLMWLGDSPSIDVAGFWQYLPSIDRNSSVEDVARQLSASWRRVWPGRADKSTDHDAYIQGVIASNREREVERKRALKSGDDPQHWPEDAFLLNMLRRLAVPHRVANQLWGWGTKQAQVEVSQAPAAAPADEWSGELLFHEENALKASGTRNFKKKLAEKTGLSEREIFRRVTAYRESVSTRKPQNSVFNLPGARIADGKRQALPSRRA